MKTSQLIPRPAFVPVQLTLETQDEVDCMHAIFNTAAISDVLRSYGVQNWPYELFEPYVRSKENTHKIFDELRESLKKRYAIPT